MADHGREESDETAAPSTAFSIFNRNLSEEVSQLHSATRMKLPSFSESDDESGSEAEMISPIRSVQRPAPSAEGSLSTESSEELDQGPLRSSIAEVEVERSTSHRQADNYSTATPDVSL